jgi:hypothetical protein
MGTARYRSFSHSSQTMYERCPRAFYYRYFSGGEGQGDEARYLKGYKCIEALAGTEIHAMISLAIRQYERTGIAPTDLKHHAVRSFHQSLRESYRVQIGLKSGRKPPANALVIMPCRKERINQTIERIGLCLDNFESSEAWRRIQARRESIWTIPHPDEKPTTYLDVNGLRVYAPYDAAFVDEEGLVHIIDWKTGAQTSEKEKLAVRQLAIYAYWAVKERAVPLSKLRVQAIWLQAPQWRPRPLSPATLRAVRDLVELAIERDAKLLKRRRDSRRRPCYVAKMADFPAKPNQKKCFQCQFSPICEERWLPASQAASNAV